MEGEVVHDWYVERDAQPDVVHMRDPLRRVEQREDHGLTWEIMQRFIASTPSSSHPSWTAWWPGSHEPGKEKNVP